jgi:hypothetical protein
MPGIISLANMSPPLLHTKLTTHPHPVYPSNAWEPQIIHFCEFKGTAAKDFPSR